MAAPRPVSRDAPVEFRSTALRPGSFGLVAAGIRDIWSRRRLVRYLVQADLKKHGADTVLGNVWWVLDPLLLMAVYVVLVGLIFDRATPDYPLFVFAALLPWKWFSASVGESISSVVSRERLIKQVQFPKLVLPVAVTVSGAVSFAFGLVALALLFAVAYLHRLTPFVLVIPVIAAVQLVFTVAVAVVLSAVNVFYRDVGNVSRHALRLWFYLSPALYSIAHVEQLTREAPVVARLMALNPFAVLFTAYRDVIYDGRAPSWVALAVLLLVSLLLLAGATLIFKRLEPAFAKVL